MRHLEQFLFWERRLEQLIDRSSFVFPAMDVLHEKKSQNAWHLGFLSIRISIQF